MMNIVIPMAGLGSRFSKKGFLEPKPLIKIGNYTMIELVIKSLNINGQYIFILNSKNDKLDELKNLLNKITKDPIIIEIDYLTEGPASTCLLAKKYINNQDPLIITNCDQIMEWDNSEFISKISDKDIDGLVVTYNVRTKKNSYVKINNSGLAIEFAEKKIISKYSLNGIHYWKFGCDFIESTEKMIEKNIRVNNEFYIAPTYNQLITTGKKIKIYHIDKKNHWAVGTPQDLKKYMRHANI